MGKKGERHIEKEIKIEVVFPAWAEHAILAAMIKAHPYEEVAYDVYLLENDFASNGSGLVGELAVPMEEKDFLH